MPGITPEQAASFYRAAAEFHRKAPWRFIGYESAIKIECRQFESGPWYAVVMGQSGLTFGMALYDDIKILRKLWAGNASDEENARESVALTVTYDDTNFITDADLKDIERHGFEVAGPEAYPCVFRKERGMSLRPPLSWELELMEGCLQAVPEFAARYRSEDTSRHELSVPVRARTLDFVLTWIED